MLKNAYFLLLLSLSLSGCGGGLDLDGKSDVELCVEAHMARHGKTAAQIETFQVPEKKAEYYLLCLRASAGK